MGEPNRDIHRETHAALAEIRDVLIRHGLIDGRAYNALPSASMRLGALQGAVMGAIYLVQTEGLGS